MFSTQIVPLSIFTTYPEFWINGVIFRYIYIYIYIYIYYLYVINNNNNNNNNKVYLNITPLIQNSGYVVKMSKGTICVPNIKTQRLVELICSGLIY